MSDDNMFVQKISKVYDAVIKVTELSSQMEAMILRMDEWAVTMERIENRFDIIEQHIDVVKSRDAMEAQKSAIPDKCKL